MSTRETFVVICREDSTPPDPGHSPDCECVRPGPYTLATRQVFPTREAARAYAEGISPSREPIVVSGDWVGLRHGLPETHYWDPDMDHRTLCGLDGEALRLRDYTQEREKVSCVSCRGRLREVRS